MIRCPKCGFEQARSHECVSCGIIFSKWKAAQSRPQAPPPSPQATTEFGTHRGIDRLLANHEVLFIQQSARNWLEHLINWEVSNHYWIYDATRRQAGMIMEESHGFLAAMARNFLGSHRPLQVSVTVWPNDELALSMQREFFFFFSDMAVDTPEGHCLGFVRRRFGIFYKRYDLVDESGEVFAQIASPFWRLWTFPIFDRRGEQVASIAKKWSGLLKEAFTDSDNFMLDFGKVDWTPSQKAVIFAAALSIDFDFFENNHQS